MDASNDTLKDALKDASKDVPSVAQNDAPNVAPKGAPNFLIAELRSDGGQMLAILSAMPKQFSTGSLGFYANQKIEIAGKRYQVQLQLVEIGSKKTKETESE